MSYWNDLAQSKNKYKKLSECSLSWRYLDLQMKRWSSRLLTDVNIPLGTISCLATTIAGEIRSLSTEEKEKIKDATPIQLDYRLHELIAFQAFMDQASNALDNPSITRAQVIIQNYICFVYLPETLFRILAKSGPSGSASKKCATFLSNNPIRAFRNAIAHGNWNYRDDYSAIVYWARKGSDPGESLVKFMVDQNELDFWQQLARCTAYAVFSNL
jgi:hypothetical protein